MRLAILLSFISVFCFSQNVQIKTFEYTTLSHETLELDYYSNSSKKKKPTIIFVHGGSFKNGSKNSTYVAPFANKFVEAGYNVVSIDYRLTLKGKSFHCNCPSKDKIRTFQNAVYDIRAATRYLIDNKKELKINTKKIILAGNSAGAEAILHTVFWNNNEYNLDKQLLSDKFKYAGVISYAGAIIDTNLISKNNVIPTALFHGTCDQYVPYKTAPHHYCPDSTIGALMLSGSFDIMKRLENLDKSYFLYSQCYAGHEINTQSISTQIDETIEFINQTVLKKKKVQIHKTEKSSKEKCNFVEVNFCE